MRATGFTITDKDLTITDKDYIRSSSIPIIPLLQGGLPK